MDMLEKLKNYMIYREYRRLKIEVDDKILMEYHFTNINRNDDSGTKYFVEEVCGKIVGEIKELGYIRQEDMASIIFNSAVYRYFGTIEFGSVMKFITKYDVDELLKLALKCRFLYGGACTEAYTRMNYYMERKSLSSACEVYIKIGM